MEVRRGEQPFDMPTEHACRNSLTHLVRHVGVVQVPGISQDGVDPGVAGRGLLHVKKNRIHQPDSMASLGQP
jgi:hypothetical protein